MTEETLVHIKAQFEQFLSLVANVLAHEKELHLIENKLRRHFNTTSSSYLCSADFRALLNRLQSSFSKNDKSTKYFTSLSSFDDQLKKHRIKAKRSGHSSSSIVNSVHSTASVNTTVSTNETTAFIPSECSDAISLRLSPLTTSEHSTSIETAEQILQTCNDIITQCSQSHNLPIISTDSETTINPVKIAKCEEKRKKKINKLEQRLSNLSKTIRKLEDQDMSLDEMAHCDLYEVESNLKKRAYDIYTELAELKNQPFSVERILDQPVSLTDNDIGHPLINKALEDMVNQTKHLPRFHDVLDTVEKSNDKYQLNLSTDVQKILAEKSFKIIGTKVKNRRMADFHDIMNSRLPEDFDIERNDPALINIEIENTLVENEREAVEKTEKIFEEFSQIDPEQQAEDNIESSDESIIASDKENEGEEEESEVEPSNETEYDIVDILPPFSSNSMSPATPFVNETIPNEESPEAIHEIALNSRTLTISSTASIPLRRATYDLMISTTEETEVDTGIVLESSDTQQAQSTNIKQEDNVQTLIPWRRRKLTSDYETLIDLHEQHITNNGSSVVRKRSSSKHTDCSDSKKLKEQSEIITLD